MDEELNSGDILLSQRENKEFYTTLCVVCIILLVYNVFLYFIAFVPIIGDSMENTIYDGQYCMVQRKLFDVDYGDIIMINTAGAGEDDHIIIKRVIAKAGDRVLFMRTEDGGNVELYVCKRGETSFTLMQEEYIKEQMIPDNLNIDHRVFTNMTVAPYSVVLGSELTALDRTTMNASRVIPDGEVFVLGDNRNVSRDSRDYGTFSYDQIISKVLYVL